MMAERHTEGGIPSIGKVAWGSHLCHFYLKPEDLIGVQVPFMKAGLENNERCYWLTADPLRAQEARAALASVMPDLDGYLERGSLTIQEVYGVSAKTSSTGGILARWEKEEGEALAAGHPGLRVAGNMGFLSRGEWPAFLKHEHDFNLRAPQRRILGLCSYNLQKCQAGDIFSVIGSHQFTLGRRDEHSWEILETLNRPPGR